jgi:hypothetical protein
MYPQTTSSAVSAALNLPSPEGLGRFEHFPKNIFSHLNL